MISKSLLFVGLHFVTRLVVPTLSHNSRDFTDYHSNDTTEDTWFYEESRTFLDVHLKNERVPTTQPSTFYFPNGEESDEEGYFNYDPYDSLFGPGMPISSDGDKKMKYKNIGWGNVSGSTEERHWREYKDVIEGRYSRNQCRSTKSQSPIDICPSEVNHPCEEFHQIRTRPGDFHLHDTEVSVKILPSKLRLKYWRRPKGVVEPDPPSADFPNGWRGFIDATNVDVKIPSEHTICGKQYFGEYSVYFVHPVRKERIVISVMIDIDPNLKVNSHFQRAIDEWQKVFDKNLMVCQEENEDTKSRTSKEYKLKWKKRRELVRGSNNRAKETNLVDGVDITSPGSWNPFHEDIMASIYFFGYWGSLTEPPCSEKVAWRIIDKPMYISISQYHQLRNILFNQINPSTCKRSSSHYKNSVARPIQRSNNRRLWQCTANDYLADN